MISIAVLGYGVVGSGVVEVLKKNTSSICQRAGEEIQVKKILDVRDFPDSPDGDLLTKNSDDIFNDDSIKIVAETIGGAGVAYEFTKKALMKGKHVVTSNKELVATHGPELLNLAREKNVRYLFEASVGGGIPIIRPLYNCLAANEISGITGILNGTTNYILTQMLKEDKDFDTALKEAQKNGYAEANPAADVEGHDACRKIAILSSIAYNEFVDYKKIPTEGISKITSSDIHFAEAMGAVIKLIAESKRVNGKIYARVGPAVVSNDHPLANVFDVFNAIVVKGDAIGDAMFYGRGAGKLPTASAVVADIIDVVKHGENSGRKVWRVNSEENMVDPEKVESQYYIRIKASNREEAEKFVNEVFKEAKWVYSEKTLPEDEIAFVTSKNTDDKLKACIDSLKNAGSVKEVANVLRILDE